jgi:hypothetical protein
MLRIAAALDTWGALTQVVLSLSATPAVQPDPRKRLGARAGPEELLQHPWFQVSEAPTPAASPAAPTGGAKVAHSS